ncbi:MAG: type III-B CRISPR module RAMP protein Cmr1 [Gammaproteobacteria bacterium]|nr:MAG: type III-B CRISPR module RAMP protein Cmr1 [Gammaproteobacteria bacterium]
MPEIIKAEYRIVTPMFIGDAEQKATGISPASIKGALRFWWRALNWGRFRKEASSDQKALQVLHQQEGDLFGSAAEKNPRQSRFAVRVKADNIPAPKDDWPKSQSDSGYLGMGLWQSGKKEKGNFQAARQYLSEGINFTVEIIIHPSLSKDSVQSLKDTIVIFGLLGGLGSRTRRAFGSVALLTLDQNSCRLDSVQCYKDAVIDVLAHYDLPDTALPYTAFSKNSVIKINPEGQSTARNAHANLGALFKRHRGQPSGLRGPGKRVFGMPYSGGGKKEKDARRASPLFMHIHQIKEKYHAVTTSFPAVFHYDKALEKVDYHLVSSFSDNFKEVPIHED